MMTEKELAKVVIDEWNSLPYRNIGKEIDKEKFKENIDFWYKNYFKKPSPKIIYCDSPKELSKLSMDKDIMYSQRVEISKDLFKKLPNYTCQIRSTANSVYSEVNHPLLIPFFKNTKDLVESSSNCFPFFRFGAHFDFLHRTGISNDPLIKVFIELIKTPSFLFYLCEDCVFVVQSPTEIQIENNRPHSIKGPAIKFRDGDEYFYFRGTEIEEKIFKMVRDKSITLEEVLKISNEEEKSAILLMYQELYGEEATYHLISESLKEVDSYYHKTGDKTLCYTLFKGQLGINEVAYVRCYCPSTDRMFFLGVQSWNTNAKNAIASLYRIPKKLKPYIKYINRQGERFTTILTEEGNEIRKNMTKKELSDLTIISGNYYFELMRYEY